MAPGLSRKTLQMLDAAMACGARACEVETCWALGSPPCSTDCGSSLVEGMTLTIAKA